MSVGGLAAQVFGYCTGLDRDRYDVALVTGRSDPHEARALEFLGPATFPIHFIEEVGRQVGVADAHALVKLRLVVRQFRPDIVHTHAAKAGTLGRLAAVLGGTPIRVHSFHGHVFHGYFSPAVSGAIVAFERTLGLATTAVIVPGESQRAEIGDRFRIVPRGKIFVAPYGIDFSVGSPTLSRDAARAHFGVTSRFVLGALGRMAPIKNQALMMDAFARMRQATGFDAQLLMVGEGECREALERQAVALQLGNAVVFRTWEPDLARVYAAIDQLVISSLNEGMPVAALEAMAAGVPVVATAVGGVVDLVRPRETGWLVPSKDPEALARAMGDALVDPDRPAILDRARREVTGRHSFANACAEIGRIYETVLSRKPSRSPDGAATAAGNPGT